MTQKDGEKYLAKIRKALRMIHFRRFSVLEIISDSLLHSDFFSKHVGCWGRAEND
jgi:hypothetical protein